MEKGKPGLKGKKGGKADGKAPLAGKEGKGPEGKGKSDSDLQEQGGKDPAKGKKGKQGQGSVQGKQGAEDGVDKGAAKGKGKPQSENASDGEPGPKAKAKAKAKANPEESSSTGASKGKLKGKQGVEGERDGTPEGKQGAKGPKGKPGAQPSAEEMSGKGAPKAKAKQIPEGMAGDEGAKGKQGKASQPGTPGREGGKGKPGPEDMSGKGAPKAKAKQIPEGMVGDEGAKGKQGKASQPGTPGREGGKGKPGPEDMSGKGAPKAKAKQIPEGMVGDEGAKGKQGKASQPGTSGKEGGKGKPGSEEMSGKGAPKAKAKQISEGTVPDEGAKGKQGKASQPGTPGREGAKGKPGPEEMSGKGTKGKPRGEEAGKGKAVGEQGVKGKPTGEEGSKGKQGKASQQGKPSTEDMSGKGAPKAKGKAKAKGKQLPEGTIDQKGKGKKGKGAAKGKQEGTDGAKGGEASAEKWTTIAGNLPTGNDDESASAREYLFQRLDLNGNSELTLSEVEAGLGRMLQMTSVTDIKTPVVNAFQAALDLAPSGVDDDTKVDIDAFHTLLIYLERYVLLWEQFSQIDESDDQRIDAAEFENAAWPLMQEWGLENIDAGVAAALRRADVDGSGNLDFNEFADFCVREGLRFIAGGEKYEAFLASRVPSLVQRLPIGSDEDSMQGLKQLFERFDTQNDGNLRLNDLQDGMYFIVGDMKSSDMRALASNAHHTAHEIAMKYHTGGVKYGLNSKDFRLFLLYIERYVCLRQHFARVDAASIDLIDVDKFITALPLLREWGLHGMDDFEVDPAAAAAAAFRELDSQRFDAQFGPLKDAERSGDVSFDEFAHFCIKQGLHIEIDSLHAEEQTEAEKKASTQSQDQPEVVEREKFHSEAFLVEDQEESQTRQDMEARNEDEAEAMRWANSLGTISHAEVETGAATRAEDEAEAMRWANSLGTISHAELETGAATQPQAQPEVKTEEEAKLQAEEEAKSRSAEEARLKAEEEAESRAVEEARLQAEEEANSRAAEEARLQAEEEAKSRAAEEARLQAEEEAKSRAAEEARLQAEEEAKSRAAEEARLQAEEEARLKAEEEAKSAAAEEARLKAEEAEKFRAALKAEEEEAAAEEARLKAEEAEKFRAALKAEEEEEEAKSRVAEEARLKAEEEARLNTEEEARVKAAEELRSKPEEEARAEDEAKAQDWANSLGAISNAEVEAGASTQAADEADAQEWAKSLGTKSHAELEAGAATQSQAQPEVEVERQVPQAQRPSQVQSEDNTGIEASSDSQPRPKKGEYRKKRAAKTEGAEQAVDNKPELSDSVADDQPRPKRGDYRKHRGAKAEAAEHPAKGTATSKSIYDYQFSDTDESESHLGLRHFPGSERSFSEKQHLSGLSKADELPPLSGDETEPSELASPVVHVWPPLEEKEEVGTVVAPPSLGRPAAFAWAKRLEAENKELQARLKRTELDLVTGPGRGAEDPQGTESRRKGLAVLLAMGSTNSDTSETKQRSKLINATKSKQYNGVDTTAVGLARRFLQSRYPGDIGVTMADEVPAADVDEDIVGKLRNERAAIFTAERRQLTQKVADMRMSVRSLEAQNKVLRQRSDECSQRVHDMENALSDERRRREGTVNKDLRKYIDEMKELQQEADALKTEMRRTETRPKAYEALRRALKDLDPQRLTRDVFEFWSWSQMKPPPKRKPWNPAGGFNETGATPTIAPRFEPEDEEDKASSAPTGISEEWTHVWQDDSDLGFHKRQRDLEASRNRQNVPVNMVTAPADTGKVRNLAKERRRRQR